ncbi:MAG: hypothetical protein Q8Q09_21370 [Deltaproteobacteria bacterium]|nr:hypothetical protein [Deltaproteobacteria bacterium]
MSDRHALMIPPANVQIDCCDDLCVHCRTIRCKHRDVRCDAVDPSYGRARLALVPLVVVAVDPIDAPASRCSVSALRVHPLTRTILSRAELTNTNQDFESIEQFRDTLEGAQLVAHDAPRVFAALDAVFEHRKLTVEMHPFALDLASLAWPLLASGRVASLSLATLTRYFDTGTQRASTRTPATQCAEQTLQVLRCLLCTEVSR